MLSVMTVQRRDLFGISVTALAPSKEEQEGGGGVGMGARRSKPRQRRIFSFATRWEVAQGAFSVFSPWLCACSAQGDTVTGRAKRENEPVRCCRLIV
jgi:hypothetical protein